MSSQQQQQQQPPAAAAAAASNDDAANMSEPDLDFDEPLGVAQGVVAYSNIDDYYFSGEKAYTYGVYTGIKYQCVEYSRRYMMLRTKCVFGQCGPAAELFKHTTVDNIETGEQFKWVACDNGATTVKPAVGMTVIYPQTKKMPVGHVANISYVSDDSAFVGIAEQNQESKFWNGKPYGRLVPLKQLEGGKWLIDETDPCLDNMSGWMYIDGVDGFEAPLPGMDTDENQSTVCDNTIHMKVYRAPTVADKFIAPQGGAVKKLIRFSSTPRVPNLPTFDNAACHDARLTRKALVEQYRDALSANFARVLADTKGTTSHVHHHRGTDGGTFRRSGVARAAEWHSEYVPNEAIAMGGIGEANRSFIAIEACVADTLAQLGAGSDEDRATFAARFDMPVAAITAAASQLAAASNTRASKMLSAADCLLGTIGLFHDPTTNANRILHAELDSLNLLMDVNVNQMAFGADLGRPFAWRMGGFGNDFHRAFRNLQRTRLGRRSGDMTLTFLDFGDVAHLKAKHGFTFASADEAHQYTVERINALYLAATMVDFLKEKAADVASGDLVEKDAPKWHVCVVEDALSRVAATTTSEAGLVLTVDGAHLPVAFKCAPWWALFVMAAKGGIAGATAIVDVATTRKDFGVVLQPLWTHITSHPAFLPHLAAWAIRHDRTATDAADPVSTRVIPIASFPDADPSTGALPANSALPPRCTYTLPAFTGTVDPEYNSGSEPRESAVTSTVAPAKIFAPAMQILVASGKRAAACALEGRHGGADEQHGDTGTDIFDAVHPAPLTMIRDLHWW